MKAQWSRVRVAGPLAPYAGGFAEDLAVKGYAEATVAEHVRLIAQLSRWMAGRSLETGDLTPARVKQFVQVRTDRLASVCLHPSTDWQGTVSTGDRRSRRATHWSLPPALGIRPGQQRADSQCTLSRRPFVFPLRRLWPSRARRAHSTRAQHSPEAFRPRVDLLPYGTRDHCSPCRPRPSHVDRSPRPHPAPDGFTDWPARLRVNRAGVPGCALGKRRPRRLPWQRT